VAVPTATIEQINPIIKYLFRLKKVATSEDIKALFPTPKPPTPSIGNALSTARDIGLTTSGGKRGLYDLTNEGKEYGRYLDADKPEECPRILRESIIKNPLWKDIVDFLRATKGQETETKDLVLSVEKKLEKQWKTDMRNLVGKCYGSILSFAGLVEYQRGKMLSKLETMPTAELQKGVPAGGVTTQGAILAPVEAKMCPFCKRYEVDVVDETLQLNLPIDGGQKLVVKSTFYCRNCRQNFSRILERLVWAKGD